MFTAVKLISETFIVFILSINRWSEYFDQVLVWRRGQKNIVGEGIVPRLENLVIISFRCIFFGCFLEDGCYFNNSIIR